MFDENNMNVGEGHLGGYIKSDDQPAPSGLDVRHGDPETWSPDLWRWLVSALNIRSVIDVGCGEGHAARFFQSLGCEVLGVDGSRQAKQDSLIPGQHDLHDYTTGPFVPDRAYDMVWCCEFVEHVEEQYVANFLATFSRASGYIVMTHATPGQPGWHHVNCQEPEYWQAHLGSIGFEINKPLTEQSRWVARTGLYAWSGTVFHRQAERSRT